MRITNNQHKNNGIECVALKPIAKDLNQSSRMLLLVKISFRIVQKMKLDLLCADIILPPVATLSKTESIPTLKFKLLFERYQIHLIRFELSMVSTG